MQRRHWKIGSTCCLAIRLRPPRSPTPGKGTSYIIQGPPGTGKSQTIANLIADYVARGKRVLFVCEKRAAIDVVHARLRQRGLGELCSLIHDSQTDKKTFVMDLKKVYEASLAPAESKDDAAKDRDAMIERLAVQLQPLEQFTRFMRSAPKQLGISVRECLELCIERADQVPELDAFDQRTVARSCRLVAKPRGHSTVCDQLKGTRR